MLTRRDGIWVLVTQNLTEDTQRLFVQRQRLRIIVQLIMQDPDGEIGRGRIGMFFSQNIAEDSQDRFTHLHCVLVIAQFVVGNACIFVGSGGVWMFATKNLEIYCECLSWMGSACAESSSLSYARPILS